ncbi:MAG: helix-turn-helix domain-containing protein [Pseudolysinimonas sp.]
MSTAETPAALGARGAEESVRYSAVVAVQVRREMGARKMSAAALADVLGCGVQTAQRKVRGDVAFTLDEVHDLALHFAVPVSTLAPETAVAA